MKFSNTFSTLTVSLMLAAAPSVFAQEAVDEGASVAAEGQQTGAPRQAAAAQVGDGQIETIVVTAQRVSENLQSTPVAVSAITGEALENKQIANVMQLQYSIPTLQIATPKDGDSSGANIGLRGQIQTYSSITVDPSVGLYVDGIYVARNAGAALDLIDMERVEVLRGPQGTLFGRNTTGGAINLIANKPRYEESGQVKVGVGNYGAWLTQAVVNAPVVDDQVAVRLVYQHNQRDGYGKSLYNGQEFGDQNSHYFRGQLLIEPAGKPLSVLLSADGSWSDNNGSLQHAYFVDQSPAGLPNTVKDLCDANGALPGCPVGSPPLFDGGDGFYTTRGDLDGKNQARALGVSATVEYQLEGATLKSISSYRNLTRAYAQDLDGTSYSLLNTHRGYVDQQQTSQELQALGKAYNDRLSWIVGAFYFQEKGQDVTESNSLAPYSPNLALKQVYAKNTSKAGYGQLTYEILKDVRMIGGLRYTKDTRFMDKRNPLVNMGSGAVSCGLQATGITGPGSCQFVGEVESDYWSWTLGPDWQISETAFVFAKASKGYRAGGLNQGGVNEATLAPFTPESVQSYEVGTKLDLFDRRLRANLGYYYGDYDNVQRPTVRVIDGRSGNLVENAAKASIQGFEAELIAKPFSRTTISASFGLTDAKYKEFINPQSGQDRSNEPFLQVPKYTVGTSADYMVPVAIGVLTFHLDYAWKSEQYYEATDSAKVGAYGLWNGLINLQLDNPNVQLSFWGRNLTGEKYYQSMTEVLALGYGVGNPGEPRMYGISATYRF